MLIVYLPYQNQGEVVLQSALAVEPLDAGHQPIGHVIERDTRMRCERSLTRVKPNMFLPASTASTAMTGDIGGDDVQVLIADDEVVEIAADLRGRPIARGDPQAADRPP